jgi:hypothetical protein
MSFFEPKELIKKPPPSHRAAYSDRTSWLMSKMSELAYTRFEKDESILAELAENLATIKSVDDLKEYLKKEVVPDILSMNDNESEMLTDNLDEASFELVKTFDKGGTQAFLAKRKTDKIAVLAFRGTEATQLSDIKADLNTITKNDEGARIHTGFLNAYEMVHNPIVKELSMLNDYALYITGHSLGGALALLATRKLELDNIAACYTFGSPRVGSSEFSDSIKTPIYRIVNTADIVPRLPPGIVIEVLVDFLRLLKGLVPFLGYIASWLDDKVSGYRHHGDMRYLTNCKDQTCTDVRLISNITPLSRVMRLLKHRVAFDRNIKDHSISEYSTKLAAYAMKRN